MCDSGVKHVMSGKGTVSRLACSGRLAVVGVCVPRRLPAASRAVCAAVHREHTRTDQYLVAQGWTEYRRQKSCKCKPIGIPHAFVQHCPWNTS